MGQPEPLGTETDANGRAVMLAGLALPVVISLLFIVYWFGATQRFSIPSASNEPTLMIGDVVQVRRYSFGRDWPLLKWLPLGEPALGDMVAFRQADNPGIVYVKRLAGMPGDTVQMRESVLYLNGKPMSRTRVGDFIDADSAGGFVSAEFQETFPNGVEARVLQLDPQAPFNNTEVFNVPEGHYFFIGDNRDNSSDSRNPNGSIGLVPRENLFGKVVWIAWSYRDLSRWLTSIDPPRSVHG
jgi:signal peptidase I